MQVAIEKSQPWNIRWLYWATEELYLESLVSYSSTDIPMDISVLWSLKWASHNEIQGDLFPLHYGYKQRFSNFSKQQKHLLDPTLHNFWSQEVWGRAWEFAFVIKLPVGPDAASSKAMHWEPPD